jgi:hypothetical protein
MNTQTINTNNDQASHLHHPDETVYGQPVPDSEIPVLEPDADVRQAITIDEFKERVLNRVREYYENILSL